MNKKEIVNGYLGALNINFEIKTLEDITSLIKAHLFNFSFSSLKVLLKEEISLNLDSIYESIVKRRRGGYCFEHNKLMYEVLNELGFDVTYYLARVINNTDNIPAQTHRFTLLEYENERYLIDVGIGFRTPSVPVKFGSKATISHLGLEYKIIENDDKTFSMQLLEKSKPFKVTKFDLNRCYESDFDMGHFYSYKNPNAVFVNNFVCSRIEEERIFSIVNDKYLIIYEDRIEEIRIDNIEQFEKIIRTDFNLNFSIVELEYFYKDLYIN